MISSTFFDLKQVRADLAHFIEDEMGCSSLVSESSSFPIDPDVDTVENCRRRVERDADILILVIGGRYGSVDSRSAKSVTNLEYLAARAKGIPIYAFVERRVHAILPIWQTNKEADFSAVVADPRVFGFIEEVRDHHKVWMQEFELAHEIIDALRRQIAYLSLQGAHFVRRARSDREYSILSELQGAPLRIALEEPEGWEYKLFGEVLTYELNAKRTLSEHRRLGITYGAYEWVTSENFKYWSMPRIAELQALLRALRVLVNEELKRAFGPPGVPGDVELIVFVARSLAVVYQEAIEWTLRIRRTVGDDGVTAIAQAMDNFVKDILEKIEALAPMLLREIDDLLAAERRGEPATRSIILELDIPGSEEAIRAIDRLSRQLR